jgi:hypothetical protein
MGREHWVRPLAKTPFAENNLAVSTPKSVNDRTEKSEKSKCRHCGKLFIPQPKKSGFIDECPQCVEERQSEAAAAAESEETIEQLKESIGTSGFAPKHSPNPEK